MTDLISRQAAIEAMKDMYKAAEKWGREASEEIIKARAESCMASLLEIKLRVDKIPSAEPERGEWEVVDESEPRRYGCNMCKCLSWDMSNFCPNCGADMREREGE